MTSHSLPMEKPRKKAALKRTRLWRKTTPPWKALDLEAAEEEGSFEEDEALDLEEADEEASFEEDEEAALDLEEAEETKALKRTRRQPLLQQTPKKRPRLQATPKACEFPTSWPFPTPPAYRCSVCGVQGHEHSLQLLQAVCGSLTCLNDCSLFHRRACLTCQGL